MKPQLPNPAPVPPVVPGMPALPPMFLAPSVGGQAALNVTGRIGGQISGPVISNVQRPVGAVGCLGCSAQLGDIKTSWPLWAKLGAVAGVGLIAVGAFFAFR